MDEHRHQWSAVDFCVEHDRPMMRQACACGGVRADRRLGPLLDAAARSARDPG